MITKTRVLVAALAFVGASAATAFANDDDYDDNDHDMQLEQLPQTVQSVVKKHVKDGRIEDIHRETKQNKTYYEVDYENAKGQDYELILTEDGHVIGNRREY